MIPFNQPAIEGRELEYIREAVAGGHSSAKGPFTDRVVQMLEDITDASAALLTTSCTSALELSAMLLDLAPGDRVIVPSFTFVTTALAFAREGAELVFADVEPDTLGIDPAHVEELIDERTRAVVTVHYAGIPCDLEGLGRVLEKHPHVALIEDNAHGMFAAHRGRPLGSFGRFSTLSFHETKNFISGEGGALLLNDPADVGRAHVLYDKGTNRRAFLQGHVDKYTWVDTGSSFGMSDLLAAFLLGQLEQHENILAKRRDVFERYEARLSEHAGPRGFRLPVIPDTSQPGYHMFYVLLPDRAMRDEVLARLNAAGVQATFHYVPLHASAGAVAVRAKETACPVTDDVSGRLLRLPFYNNLSMAEVDRVADAFLDAVDAVAA